MVVVTGLVLGTVMSGGTAGPAAAPVATTIMAEGVSATGMGGFAGMAASSAGASATTSTVVAATVNTAAVAAEGVATASAAAQAAAAAAQTAAAANAATAATAAAAGGTAAGAGGSAAAATGAGVASGPLGWILIGASPEPSSTSSSVTWDCWKPIVLESSAVPSQGMLLRDLARHKHVSKIVCCEGSVSTSLPSGEENVRLLAENIKGHRFYLDLLVLPCGQRAFHATAI